MTLFDTNKEASGVEGSLKTDGADFGSAAVERGRPSSFKAARPPALQSATTSYLAHPSASTQHGFRQTSSAVSSRQSSRHAARSDAVIIPTATADQQAPNESQLDHSSSDAQCQRARGRGHQDSQRTSLRSNGSCQSDAEATRQQAVREAGEPNQDSSQQDVATPMQSLLLGVPDEASASSTDMLTVPTPPPQHAAGKTSPPASHPAPQMPVVRTASIRGLLQQQSSTASRPSSVGAAARAAGESSEEFLDQLAPSAESTLSQLLSTETTMDATTPMHDERRVAHVVNIRAGRDGCPSASVDDPSGHQRPDVQRRQDERHTTPAGVATDSKNAVQPRAHVATSSRRLAAQKMQQSGAVQPSGTSTDAQHVTLAKGRQAKSAAAPLDQQQTHPNDALAPQQLAKQAAPGIAQVPNTTLAAADQAAGSPAKHPKVKVTVQGAAHGKYYCVADYGGEVGVVLTDVSEAVAEMKLGNTPAAGTGIHVFGTLGDLQRCVVLLALYLCHVDASVLQADVSCQKLLSHVQHVLGISWLTRAWQCVVACTATKVPCRMQ